MIQRSHASIVGGALAAFLFCAVQASAQTRPGARTPQTDETVPATKGARLAINHFAGEVTVRAWDRDAVRVQAHHGTRTRVSIRPTEAAITVTARGSAGPSSVDYEISAPAWMPLKIYGTYIFVTVEGTRAEVSVETVRGDVTVKGGSGSISARSVEGAVVIEGAQGRITANSTNDKIAISDSRGDIVAETINGGVTLSRIESSNVEATTVNGGITYEGNAAAGGRYRLYTHNGNIIVAVPETSSAVFAVRTYNGEFSSGLPTKGEGDVRKGRRVLFVMGSGAAEFELETFGGSIRLRPAGGDSRPRENDQHRDQ